MSKAIESLSPADKAALKAVLDPMFEATLDAQIAAIGYWRVDSYGERGDIAPAYGDRCRVVNATETAPGSGLFGPPSRDFVYTQGGGTGGADAWVGEQTDAEQDAILDAAFADIDANIANFNIELVKRQHVVETMAQLGAMTGDYLYYGRHVYVVEALREFVYTKDGNGPGQDAWLGYISRSELDSELAAGHARDDELYGLIDDIQPADIAALTAAPAYGELGATTSSLALGWSILIADGTPLAQVVSWGGNVVHMDGNARALTIPPPAWATQHKVLVVGDSLMSPGPTDAMADDLDLTVTRAALGAQTSYKQALRVGARPLYVTLSGNTLPASGTEATVTLLNGAAPDLANPASLLTTAAGDTGPGHHISGTIAGVAVTMSHYPATDPNVYKMTQAGGAPVTVPAGSLFVPDWAAMMATHEVWICVGTNDEDLDETRTNVAAMIRMGRGNQYILFSPLNTPSTGKGSARLAAINAFRAWALSTFPGIYALDGAGRDNRERLLASGTGSGDDLADFNNEVIPRSLRVAPGDLHPNSSGYAIWKAMAEECRAARAAPATSIADGTVITLNANGRLRQLTFAKLPRRYWGVSANAALTGAQVIALAGSELSAGRAKAFTATAADQYVYFAYLASLGDPTGYAIGGFAEGYVKTVVSVTTAAGHTADYILIRSTNKLTGTVPVEVK